MLISDAYRAQQEYLHETTEYGVASKSYAPIVTQIIDRLQINHLLDYGCGKSCHLLRSVKPGKDLKYQAYDPAVPRFSAPPVPAELVCCIDVLEHIEPDCLEDVLDDLERLTEAAAFLTIHTGPAVKVLQDGRNAHLTQEDMRWWLPKLWARFDLQTVQITGEHSFYVIGMAKQKVIELDGQH